MFNFFKKKEKPSGLMAAAREMMANEAFARTPTTNNSTLSFQEIHRHRFIRQYASVQEVEADNMVSNPRLGDKPVPFGFNNHQWQELLAEMQNGDELWTFCTSDESWDNGCGRAGISLVRNGKEVNCIIGKMN
jgi:hypothetical protein